MRRGLLGIGLGFAVASVAVLACTGGPGDLTPFSVYDNNPGEFESPGAGRESPGPGREVPPPTFPEPPTGGGENPGTHGGGPGSPNAAGSSECPPCPATFDCQVTVNGQSITGTFTLKKDQAGQCVDDKGDAVYACGGEILSAGQSVGTWSSNGDTFTASGGSASVSCKKKADQDGGGVTPVSDASTPIGDAAILEASTPRDAGPG